MHLKQLRWLLVILVLAFANSAQADSVTVDGSYSFASNGYGIPPYGGMLNGQSASFYCIDFTHDISGGMNWGVTTTSLSGSDFSSTRLSSTLGSGAQTVYLEMAYLITQMMGLGQKMDPASQLLKAEDQYAIWSFTGGPNPYGTNSAIVAAALAAVEAGFNGQGFEILTPTGSTGQEFLVSVSEPCEILMLMIGLILIGIAMRKRSFAGVETL
jgi:hypothetical protein